MDVCVWWGRRSVLCDLVIKEETSDNLILNEFIDLSPLDTNPTGATKEERYRVDYMTKYCF